MLSPISDKQAKTRCSSRICIFAVLIAAGYGRLWAQCQSQPSDTTFLMDNTLSTINSVEFVRTTDLPTLASASIYQITRVVGPGTASEFDAFGFLAPGVWDLYTRNGVLSKRLLGCRPF